MIKKDCKYYPCHDLKDMQCDYCFCPLYPCEDIMLGQRLENGYWDCSQCTLLHTKEFIKVFKKTRS